MLLGVFVVNILLYFLTNRHNFIKVLQDVVFLEMDAYGHCFPRLRQNG